MNQYLIRLKIVQGKLHIQFHFSRRILKSDSKSYTLQYLRKGYQFNEDIPEVVHLGFHYSLSKE
jgi:hypothetical protein